ncbi:MAG: DMT family transporter [Polyangiaceae bacterium]|nr:DMT family transporter [Polyangiaceae bacterium]
MPGRPSPIFGGVLLAGAAAVAFGLTTPVIALAGAGVGPFTTAALLYAGAASISLVTRAFVRRSGAALRGRHVPRLVAVALFGAVVAPSLLAWGIQRTGATTASLVLNLEAVASVLLARLVYRELLGRRVLVAVGVMLAGGVLVTVEAASAPELELAGALAVVAATVCWAADNTLTRPLADLDPAEVVAGKGALGAVTTAALAWAAGEPVRDAAAASAVGLLVCGATGYGLSLRLYLLAQRRIGAARTASVFATGPFVGAAVAWALGDRAGGLLTLAGGLAFALGVVLHATERHRHPHTHEALEHAHAHRHDDGHHDHAHAPPFAGEHTHRHRHGALEHDHEHAPDLHHGHGHGRGSSRVHRSRSGVG